MTHEPIRLLADPTTTVSLRRDLSAATQHVVAYDVSAGVARFETKLSQGAGTMSSGWSVAAAIGAGALILGGLIAGAGLLPRAQVPESDPAPLTGALVASEEGRPPAAIVIPPVEAPVEASLAPIGPPSKVLEDRDEETEHTSSAARPSRPSRARPRRNSPEQASTPVSTPPNPKGADYLREAKSLQAARGLLGEDPTAALARAEAGAREFVGGAFAQEWEGVAILALFELGRPEARGRAQEFLARYPKGPYSVQVRDAAEQR